MTFEEFIQPVICSTTHRPDGTAETARAPAMWTLTHRGYGGSGRLDVWGYRSEQDALRAGAKLALECGFDEDPAAVRLFQAGRYRHLLDHYEDNSPPEHVLRVVPAFLQVDDEMDGLDQDSEMTGGAEPLPPFAALFPPARRRNDRADRGGEDNIVLTARNAAVLWECAQQAAADAESDIATFGDHLVHGGDERWRIFDEYLRSRTPRTRRGGAELAARSSRRGRHRSRTASARCPAEELALHLVLNAAEAWSDEVAPAEAARLMAGLSTAREDGDWDSLREGSRILSTRVTK